VVGSTSAPVAMRLTLTSSRRRAPGDLTPPGAPKIAVIMKLGTSNRADHDP